MTDEAEEERVCIMLDAGMTIERARAIALCERIMREQGGKCLCGAGHRTAKEEP